MLCGKQVAHSNRDKSAKVRGERGTTISRGIKGGLKGGGI